MNGSAETILRATTEKDVEREKGEEGGGVAKKKKKKRKEGEGGSGEVTHMI